MVKFYRHYFEQLAKNPILQHVDKDNASFFYVRDKYSLDAFDKAIKSAAKTPAMLLERYSKNVTDNDNRNHFQPISGRFNILVKAENGNEASIIEAEERAEAIADEIIRKMRADFADGSGVIEHPDGSRLKVMFEIRNVPVDPIGPVAGNYYGVTVGFVWRCPFSASVTAGNWQ